MRSKSDFSLLLNAGSGLRHIKPSRVQISLAAFPGLRHEEAAQAAINASRAGRLTEPFFCEIDCEHVQLVPQNHGLLDRSLCESLMSAFPGVQFRLHANVRVLNQRTVADISCLSLYEAWFRQAASISRLLGAKAYSAHSGMRSEADFQTMLNNARRLADMFDCPVAIEGQYPTQGDTFLVSTWGEYRALLDSKMPYALDLSHVNILASQSGRYELGLLQEMLSCERCLEVHVSENDGSGDWHQVCIEEPWWGVLLPCIHEDAVVFTEGNHRRRRQAP
jgi:hypothetical protein